VRVLLLLVAAPWLAQALLAQNISVGVRGGLPLTDALSTIKARDFSFSSNRPRYAVGPTFEVRLPMGLGFHVDALYRKVSVNASTGSTTTTNSFSFWQFPVMVKLRVGAGPIRPFVSGGPSFSKLSGVGDAATCLVRLGANSCSGRVLKSTGTGVAAAFGIDMALPGIRLAPELRYTRLGANFFEGAGVAGLATQRNQLELLLGVTF
jgi:hypothetical protein